MWVKNTHTHADTHHITKESLFHGMVGQQALSIMPIIIILSKGNSSNSSRSSHSHNGSS